MPGVTFNAKSAPIAGGAVLTSYVDGEVYCCICGGCLHCMGRVVPRSVSHEGEITNLP